jgi:translation initiation factor IF-2
MNITILSRRLNMPVPELLKKINSYGFKLRNNTKKISDRKAKEIIKKVERERREAEKKKKEVYETPDKIAISTSVTVKEFASKLNMPVTKVIMELMKNGIMATINEEIDYETATIVASELGVKVEEHREEKDILKEEGIRKKILLELKGEKGSKLKSRSPVVCVLGHVDHGKTTLLDAIRETNIAGGESGGITQHIGAYQAKIKGKLITFLDTPGHEAFKAMRERGAKVTDIAILVVAADDSVQPQTKEAIAHVKKAKVPMVVALNKIDKPDADIERTKKELADQEVLTEEWGGDTICVPISAKQRQNLDKLLESVLLVAEMEELKANPDVRAIGTIIESNMDSEQGPVATVLVQNGTLKLHDPVTVFDILGNVKSMENFQGKKIDHAKPSTPVRIFGLEKVPQVGDILQVEENKEEARRKADSYKKIKNISKKFKKETNKQTKTLNIILATDVQGSMEAIMSELNKIEIKNVDMQIINFKVGKISESDVMMASSTNSIIIGFNTSITSVASRMAEDKKIEVKIYKIIYEMLDEIKAKLKGLVEVKRELVKIGKLEVLALFRTEKDKKIVGGKIVSGKMKKGVKIKVVRDDEIIGEGKLTNLQLNKKDTPEVESGKECGITFTGHVKIKEGDVLEGYEEKEVENK